MGDRNRKHQKGQKSHHQRVNVMAQSTKSKCLYVTYLNK